ncbi:hypothetical protein BDZ89DRAFT_955026, partial [Hymenopellis radicata]
TEIIKNNQDTAIGEPLVPFFWGEESRWNLGPVSSLSSPILAPHRGHVHQRTVDLNFTLTRSPHLEQGTISAVRDLWRHDDIGLVDTSSTAVLPHMMFAHMSSLSSRRLNQTTDSMKLRRNIHLLHSN